MCSPRQQVTMHLKSRPSGDYVLKSFKFSTIAANSEVILNLYLHI